METAALGLHQRAGHDRAQDEIVLAGQNFCFGHILEAHTQEEINRQRDAIIDANETAGKKLSQEGAIDEMVANACEQMLLNSDILSELYKQNASLAQKVQIKVSEFFAKLRQNIGNGARVKEAAWMADAIDELQEKWEAALRVAAANQIKLNSVEGTKNTATEGGEVQYALVGYTANGIEVYETSEEVKQLSWKERKKRFLDIMRNEYRGRTAKFTRNGHTYYATLEVEDINKNIYGDKESDVAGKDAKVKTGADGSFFELVENSEYFFSQEERGKDSRAHRNNIYWDYYIKTVQIDSKVFELLANVRKTLNGEYVYSIELYENKKIEAASPSDTSQKTGGLLEGTHYF